MRGDQKGNSSGPVGTSGKKTLLQWSEKAKGSITEPSLSWDLGGAFKPKGKAECQNLPRGLEGH